jgi:hypothetical protein
MLDDVFARFGDAGARGRCQSEFFDLMSALEEENPVPDANASLNETSWGGI